jgi:hypothetical protein
MQVEWFEFDTPAAGCVLTSLTPLWAMGKMRSTWFICTVKARGPERGPPLHPWCAVGPCEWRCYGTGSHS